jgi:uncharacterized protein YggE
MSALPALTRALAAIAALAAAHLIALPAPALADEKPRTVAVTGTGSAKAKPDTAHVTTGVVSEGRSARAALDTNSAAMKKLMAALKAKGLEPRDIQTTDFSVRPVYSRPKKGEARVITGYQVVNTVRAAVRDLDALGPVLDAAVSSGANQIGSISFSIAEPDALADAARKDAMADAKHKAELLAGAAGASLGEVMTISEQTYAPVARQVRARVAEAAVPVAAGELTVEIRVSVTWELE